MRFPPVAHGREQFLLGSHCILCRELSSWAGTQKKSPAFLRESSESRKENNAMDLVCPICGSRVVEMIAGVDGTIRPYCAECRDPYPLEEAGKGPENSGSAKPAEDRLAEVDKHIAEAQGQIEQQRSVLQKLREGGHSDGAREAKELLTILEDSLSAHKERKETILQEQCHPKASSQRN